MRRRLLTLFCLAWLPACSIVNLAYDNASTLVSARLDDAFALTDAQRSTLEPRLGQLLEWHRNDELPRYRVLLDEAATRAEDGVSAAEIVWLSDSVRAAWRRLLARTIECCGDLALELESAQIEHFADYFRDESAEYEEYLALSQQQRDILRLDRQTERLEEWFGDFDYALERKIRRRLETVPDIRQSWIRYREARHREVLRVLRTTGDADAMRRALAFAMLSPDSAHAREFEVARQAYWREFAAAIEDIGGWISPRQLRHAVERLRGYARVVGELEEAG